MLYAHQQRLIDRKPSRVALVWETGTGKSIGSLALCAAHNAKTVIVICPKALKTKWENDCQQFLTCQHRVLTKEEFKKVSGTAPYADAVIVDEAHHFFGMSSLLSRSLRAYLNRHNTPIRILATATPFRSSPWDAFVMAEILGYRQNYALFKKKYFYELKMGARTVPVPRKDYKEKLLVDIKAMADIVRLDECVDVPDQVFDLVLVPKTSSQTNAEFALTEFMPLPRLTQEHQIAGGYNPTTGEPVDGNKLPALLSIIDENDRVVVVAKYRKEQELIVSALRAHDKTLPVYEIHGDVKDRHAVLSSARAQNRFVIVSNAETMEGWECPEAAVMVFYSYSWKLVSYVQALGRIQRINAVKRNVYVSLVVDGSVDKHVYDAIMGKRDFQVELYNK